MSVPSPIPHPGTERVSWTRVALFYAVACLVSWPFFWWRDMAPASWAAWQAPGFLKAATFMWGPGVAALVCLVSFRRCHRRSITLVGTSVARSLAFYLGPLALLAVVGTGGEWDRYGLHLMIAFIAFATIFGEELGWRGFLQDALRPLSTAKRYLLIGVMWEFWHFTNRIHFGTPTQIAIRLLVSYPAVIVLAWLIGEAVERSRSLLVAHSLHLWVDLLFEAGSWRTAAVLAASLPFWIWLLRGWPGAQPWCPWPMRPAPIVEPPDAGPAAELPVGSGTTIPRIT